MEIPAVPHLSVDGWITNKNMILLKVFEHFLASDYSQSNIFDGKVGSLKYMTNQYKEVYDLQQALVAVLSTMFGAYFREVSVIVDIDNTKDESVNDISIDIEVIDYDDSRYTLSQSIREVGGNILNFDKLMTEIYEQYGENYS